MARRASEKNQKNAREGITGYDLASNMNEIFRALRSKNLQLWWCAAAIIFVVRVFIVPAREAFWHNFLESFTILIVSPIFGFVMLTLLLRSTAVWRSNLARMHHWLVLSLIAVLAFAPAIVLILGLELWLNQQYGGG